MTVPNRNQQDEPQAKDDASETPLGPSVKKVFVQPEISAAVDVLEAISFFQALDSGTTN
ncbi:MAG TPA: hypothetical protein VKB46_04670 [Pyrinomonadaceae bacterium]|nr:hypothetical protein [Pyrinomonadaceae bacterium]